MLMLLSNGFLEVSYSFFRVVIVRSGTAFRVDCAF
jgi:hypothetical protein